MKNILTILSVLGLSACAHSTFGGSGRALSTSTTPISNSTTVIPSQNSTNTVAQERPIVQAPQVPEVLRQSPRALPPLVDSTLKGVMRDGARTDSMYNDLATRYMALLRFYQCVREGVNNQDADAIRNCS